MNISTLNPSGQVALLTRINQLVIKSFNVKTASDLIFVIVNDTLSVVNYDRAYLWDMTKAKPALLGISGELSANPNTEIAMKWQTFVMQIPKREQPQVMMKTMFAENQQVWDSVVASSSTVLTWLPIKIKEELTLGLVLERWNAKPEEVPSQEYLEILKNTLLLGYASSWNKLKALSPLSKYRVSQRTKWWAVGVTFLFLLLYHIPLRISAPCEVITKESIVVTAPLEGIIEQVKVTPGDVVSKGDRLIDYDKKIPMQDLKAAENQVEILQAQLNRATVLGYKDEKSRTELELLKLDLDKGKIALDLAKYKISQLTVDAPNTGVVSMESSPQDWRGKPVKIGEKVMVINNPKQTKIRLWIPEMDNVNINPNEPIYVFLNIDPTKAYKAHLRYIADESSVSGQHMTNYLAEADWEEEPPNMKLGLRGTAILYGEKVSVLFYIFRKPIFLLRSFFGL